MFPWSKLLGRRSRTEQEMGKDASGLSADSLEMRIRAVLAERLGGAAGDWSLEAVYAKPVAGGRDMVFRAEMTRGGQRVAVKANARRQTNARHYKAMVALHRVMQGAIAPLFLDPEGSFFAMDWVEAPLLSSYLDGPGRESALRRSGAWLAQLHSTTAAGDGIDARLSELTLPRAQGETGDLEGVACTRLRARAARLASMAGPVAMLHGDFQLHNLFDLDNRIVAFDRPQHRHGLVYFDLARCRVGLRLYRDLAAAEGRPWPGDGESDCRLVLEGYGHDLAERQPLFDFVEDLVLFQVWHQFRMRAGVKAAGPVRMRRNRARAGLLRTQMVERGLLGP